MFTKWSIIFVDNDKGFSAFFNPVRRLQTYTWIFGYVEHNRTGILIPNKSFFFFFWSLVPPWLARIKPPLKWWSFIRCINTPSVDSGTSRGMYVWSFLWSLFCYLLMILCCLNRHKTKNLNRSDIKNRYNEEKQKVCPALYVLCNCFHLECCWLRKGGRKKLQGKKFVDFEECAWTSAELKSFS